MKTLPVILLAVQCVIAANSANRTTVFPYVHSFIHSFFHSFIHSAIWIKHPPYIQHRAKL